MEKLKINVSYLLLMEYNAYWIKLSMYIILNEILYHLFFFIIVELIIYSQLFTNIAWTLSEISEISEIAI